MPRRTIPHGVQLALLASLLLLPIMANANLFYVDADSTAAAPDGASWITAYPTIQAAIDAAVDAGASEATPAEVWVAAGTYTGIGAHIVVSESDNDEFVVAMAGNIQLYGGFSGIETQREQRDWTQNASIIDGGEVRHCVYGADNAVLDGFIVQNGKCGNGAGMYNLNAAPTVTHCTFTNNWVYASGAGMCNNGSSPTITDCIFSGNQAVNGHFDPAGGGMINFDCAPVITNCIFTENTAFKGGAMYNNNATPTVNACTFEKNTGSAMWNHEGSPILNHCVFSQNETDHEAGAMFNRSSSPTLNHCIFTQNSAQTDAGAVFNYDASATLLNCTFTQNEAMFGTSTIQSRYSSLTLTNCVFVKNSSTYGRAVMENDNTPAKLFNCTFAQNGISTKSRCIISNNYSSPTLINCIVWNNLLSEDSEEICTFGDNAIPVASYCCIEGGYDGEGNIDQDPLFADPQQGDFSLQATSPCIDTGTASQAPETDITGKARPQQAGIDMGAYEYSVYIPLTITKTNSGVSFLQIGKAFTLSVTAIGGNGPLSYQWQKRVDTDDSKASTWVPILNADQPNYTLAAVQQSDSGQYRCEVSDGESIAYSPIITLNAATAVPAASTLGLGVLGLFSILGGGTTLLRRRK